MANSIFTIHPYKKKGMWVFDDVDRELNAEPFVCGIPEMINHFTKEIPKATKGFTLLFSSTPLPDAAAHLVKEKEEGKGTWYKLAGTNQLGWLCPVLYLFFKKPPKNIYCKFQPLQS